MERRGDKLKYMDGLRGLAVLVVLLCHFALAFFPSLYFGPGVIMHIGLERWIYNSPLNLLIAGEFAVCIFFIISGFVLSYRYFYSQDPALATSGAVRRYVRLMPAVFASVMLSFALLAAGLYSNQPVAAITGSTMWLGQSWLGQPNLMEAVRFAVYDVFFTGDHVMKYNNVLWTMKIELLGSLMVFATLALFGRLRRRWIVYGLMVVALHNSYYLAFLMGVMLSDWVVHEHKRGRRLGTALFGWAALAQGLSIGALNVFHPVHAPYRVFFYVTGAALIIIGVLQIPIARRALSARPLLYVGHLSYGIYLLHLSVLASVGCAVFLRAYPVVGYKLAFILSFGISVPVTFVLSELLTRFVDQPAIKWSGLIYRRIFSNESKEPSARNAAAVPSVQPELPSSPEGVRAAQTTPAP